jgi:hypothetical protein
MANCLRKTVLLAAFGLLFATTACNDVPIHNVSKTFAIEVSEVSENQDPIQLDFLWVIDNSASMCQEQFALAQSFDSFVLELQTYLKNIDIRLAVTTMDAFEQKIKGKIVNPGQFNNTPATTFPPACFETRVHPCLGNEDCQKKFGPGWECKAYPADDMYNMNRSVNSYCTFRCKEDGDCCGEFCYEEKCGSDQSCLLTQCADAPNDTCSFECRKPGQDVSGSGCLRPPDTEDCPSSLPPVLSMNTLDLFKCNATVEPQQNYTANIEQGLKTAWMALDPEGVNAKQSAGFLRPDAYLIVVFVTDEDDCSIHENFASPNYTCESDDDCLNGAGKCRTDMYFSKKKGKQIKLCEGLIKKDYYNVCSLLGDFKGDTHHSCAYDLDCRDCQSDEDCDYGWYCKQDKKCRPYIYSLSNIATYQTPPGTPINALTPVADYYSRFRSLKSDPAKVLVAAIVGDGLPTKPGGKTGEPEQDSLISTACMANEKLTYCAAFAKVRDEGGDCVKDPQAEGCEEIFRLKRECIQECYIASKGDPQNPTVAKNTYVCESEYGKADFGSRYVQLAEMFGPNGMVSNVCSEDGITPALKTIAELVIKRVTKICLPFEPKTGQTIIVTQTIVHEDGSMEEPVHMTEGDSASGGDYRIEFPTQECCFPDDKGDCTGTLKAITFNDVLDPKSKIEVRYEAQIGEEEEE